MSDDLVKRALAAFEAGPQLVPMNDFALMCREVMRLRELVKAAEWGDPIGGTSCPWCSVDSQSRHGEHYDHCAAFNQDGTVK
jgi:hypothetical protein